MTTFALGAALLIALAAWMLRAGRPALSSTTSAPIVALGEQLAALDREHASGQLDAEQHRLARDELQRRLLDEAATAEPAVDPAGGGRVRLFAMLAVPLAALALYAAIGNPAGWSAAQTLAPPEASDEAVQAMLATLAQRLDKPSGNDAADLQGWTLLARSYATLQRFADADRAYARAIALAPRDAQLRADRADVLAVVQGQRTTGEPDRLIAEALQLDPRNLKALALAGTAAFQRRDLAAARGFWRQARELAPPGSEFATGLDRNLAELGTEASAPAADAAPPSAPARIVGGVSLAPALAAQVGPNDTVFVFARAADGPRMPLAVVRRRAADLPFTFTLDDSLAMSPERTLSSAGRVVVGARISRSGSATPQAGDLRGESAPTGTRVEGLQLVIDTAQP
jgi:cytochrome c-type biogenesis protein CcmH